MSLAASLFEHPATQPVLLVMLVTLLDRLWVWPEKYHPLTFARLLARRMAEKVHPDINRSVMQQQISGSLAILVLLLPVVVVLYILISLAHYPFFFEGILLLIAMQFQSLRKRCLKISHCLAREQKALARHTLAPMVLRETDKLSPVGLGKASIESLLLRFVYQYCGVVFWFLLLGGVAALGYRLLLEFAWQWNHRLPRYTWFGRPAAIFTYWLQWLPVRFGLCCFAVAEGLQGAWRGLKQRPKSSQQRQLVLAVTGGALGIELSGPAYYAGNKIRLAKVGGERDVRHGDIRRAVVASWRCLFVMLTFYMLIATVIYAVSSGAISG